MYMVNVYKHGELQYTEITGRETAVAFCHMVRRLANCGLTARMEELV